MLLCCCNKPLIALATLGADAGCFACAWIPSLFTCHVQDCVGWCLSPVVPFPTAPLSWTDSWGILGGSCREHGTWRKLIQQCQSFPGMTCFLARAHRSLLCSGCPMTEESISVWQPAHISRLGELFQVLVSLGAALKLHPPWPQQQKQKFSVACGCGWRQSGNKAPLGSRAPCSD